MKDWHFSKPIHWHGKGFSLQWDFPNAWLVLVHFANGEQKRWYKRTERPYRFRRWFFRKGKDRFQNIANLHHPLITLYVFSGFSPFPKTKTIPMEVHALRVQEPEAALVKPMVKSALPHFRKELPGFFTLMPQLLWQKPEMEINLVHPPLSSARLNADFEYFVQTNSIPSPTNGNA